jgi:hypothetical protein
MSGMASERNSKGLQTAMILIQTAQFDQPYSIDISKESKVSV